MSEGNRRLNWSRIVSSARSVTFIDGQHKGYTFKDRLSSLPDSADFHAPIRY
jgi:hypothetical protein